LVHLPRQVLVLQAVVQLLVGNVGLPQAFLVTSLAIFGVIVSGVKTLVVFCFEMAIRVPDA
jgi:hypothetical protein